MYKSKVQLQQEAIRLITSTLKECEECGSKMEQTCSYRDSYAEILLRQLEPLIWNYAPLPVSIQEALNSGDGAYRP